MKDTIVRSRLQIDPQMIDTTLLGESYITSVLHHHAQPVIAEACKQIREISQ